MSKARHCPPAEPTSTRDRHALYLFAYDIGDDRRAREVRACLQRWRLDGQYSVHETRLLPFQARELAAELLDYVDPALDSLLLGRLDQRHLAPIRALSIAQRRRPPLVGWPGPKQGAFSPRSGWYLLTYDVADPRRLQRVQKRAAKACVYLQRSVYLYHGAGERLGEVLAAVRDQIKPGIDDVRLYALSGAGDLWFLSGPLPPLATLTRIAGASLWQKLIAWFKQPA
ncbi:MAG: CRISPR-associated endonuclease Cas2 [Gammaproteobacteria bacterium]|nr:CRISPR-associated endonuclease Cas2 [Gammaproteobacteria bacterium]